MKHPLNYPSASTRLRWRYLHGLQKQILWAVLSAICGHREAPVAAEAIAACASRGYVKAESMAAAAAGPEATQPPGSGKKSAWGAEFSTLVNLLRIEDHGPRDRILIDIEC